MSVSSICEYLETCSFFTIEIKVESIAQRFKKRYCLSCKEACAIFMIYQAIGAQFVPQDLYPNEYDRALDILSKHPK